MFTIETIRNAKVEALDGVGKSYGYFYTLETTLALESGARIVDYTGYPFPAISEALTAYNNGENFNLLIEGAEFEAVNIENGIAIFSLSGVKLFSVISL